jgi:hypothetical protein
VAEKMTNKNKKGMTSAYLFDIFGSVAEPLTGAPIKSFNRIAKERL